MEAIQLAVQVGDVVRARGTPVVQSGMKGESVSEAVSDGKPARTLQLSQHDYHLSGNKRGRNDFFPMTYNLTSPLPS